MRTGYPQYDVVRLSAPSSEPLALVDAKSWLRVTNTADDLLITGLCVAARKHAERYCRLAQGSFLQGEQWRLSLSRSPGSSLRDSAYVSLDFADTYFSADAYVLNRPRTIGLELPLMPIVSVDAVSYTDTEGTLQVLPSTSYEVVQDGDLSFTLYPIYPNPWPATRIYENAVQVTYTTAAPDEAVVLAIKQFVAHWYANREAVSAAPTSPVPLAAEKLLDPLRNLEF